MRVVLARNCGNNIVEHNIFSDPYQAANFYQSYLGKHGTTLARVYISNWFSLNYVPYRRDDLCDVSCRYKYEPLHNRLYDFHHE